MIRYKKKPNYLHHVIKAVEDILPSLFGLGAKLRLVLCRRLNKKNMIHLFNFRINFHYELINEIKRRS